MPFIKGVPDNVFRLVIRKRNLKIHVLVQGKFYKRNACLQTVARSAN